MRAASQQSFDEFYRSTARQVVHLILATTGNRTLAEECTQEAYTRAWRDWDRVSGHDDPLSWVRTVARREAISRWRKDQNARRAQLRLATPDDAPAPSENRVLVVEALKHLPQELRETLALHYLADLSIEQIASETDTPPGTIKARLHRGRHQLAAQLRSSQPKEQGSHD